MISIVKPPCWPVRRGETKCSPPGTNPDCPSSVRKARGVHRGIHTAEAEAWGLFPCGACLRTRPASRPRAGSPPGLAPRRSQKWFAAGLSLASGLVGSRDPLQGRSASPVLGDALPVKSDSALCPNAGVAFLVFAPKDVSAFTRAITLAQPPRLCNAGLPFLSGKLMELDYGLIREESDDSSAIMIQVRLSTDVVTPLSYEAEMTFLNW